jgi:hypothetical protein
VAIFKNDDQVALLAQAKAQLSADRATLAEAEKNLARDQALVNKHDAAQATLDASRRAREVAQAAVARTDALVHIGALVFVATMCRSPAYL